MKQKPSAPLCTNVTFMYIDHSNAFLKVFCQLIYRGSWEYFKDIQVQLGMYSE